MANLASGLQWAETAVLYCHLSVAEGRLTPRLKMIPSIVTIMGTTTQSKILWPLVLPLFKFDCFTAWHILSIVLKPLFAANEFVAELQIVKLIVTLMCTLRPALINHNHQLNGGFHGNQSRSWTNQHEGRKAKQSFLATLVPVMLGVCQLLKNAPEYSQDMIKSDYCCARTMQYTFCQ